MSVSVVIPTVLARPSVARSVEQAITAAAKTGPDAEVIVVVNGPEAAGRDLPIRSPHLRVLRIERASAPGARNVGIQEARNHTICFTDDDCMVPDDWCTTFVAALETSGAAAAGGPVRLAVQGPVTAFINHQRVFDAPPDGRGGLKYVVTANGAYRRDRVPVDHRFDDLNFNHAAEDADFGYRLHDAGYEMHWMATSEPVMHRLTESVHEITERFMRYGRANSPLYLRKGRWQESIPDPLAIYGALCSGISIEIRRFDEVDDAASRFMFSCYNQIQSAAFVLGYLEAMSTELGERLVTVDEPALSEAWQQLDEEVRQAVDGEYPANDELQLTFRLDRLNHRHRQGDFSAFHQALAKRLSALAPAGKNISAATRTLLDVDSERSRAARAQTEQRFEAELRATGVPGLPTEAFDQVARRAGLTFSDASQYLETLLSSRSQRAQR